MEQNTRLAILAFNEAETPVDKQAAIDEYQQIDLKKRYQWPAAIDTSTAEGREQSLDQLFGRLAYRRAVNAGDYSGGVFRSGYGNEDAERLAEMRLKNLRQR